MKHRLITCLVCYLVAGTSWSLRAGMTKLTDTETGTTSQEAHRKRAVCAIYAGSIHTCNGCAVEGHRDQDHQRLLGLCAGVAVQQQWHT